MKNVVLTVLQSNQHLLTRALELREAVWTRWQVAKSAFAKPLQWGGPVRHQSAVPVCDPEALILYRRAMSARGLDAIKDIYAFYSSNVLGGSSIAAAPAARLAKIPDASFEEVSGWLEEAVRRSPDFAEAWLELGFLRKEAGKGGVAIDAFDRAQNAMPAFDQNLGQPHLRAIAGTERAQLLAQRGQSEAALAQLDAMLGQRWLPWTFYLCRARLLLARGRAREALAAFEQCLTWTNIEPRFPVLPGRIEELEQWLGR
jgi:tetratricopeptide (TPR) repeat protein